MPFSLGPGPHADARLTHAALSELQAKVVEVNNMLAHLQKVEIPGKANEVRSKLSAIVQQLNLITAEVHLYQDLSSAIYQACASLRHDMDQSDLEPLRAHFCWAVRLASGFVSLPARTVTGHLRCPHTHAWFDGPAR